MGNVKIGQGHLPPFLKGSDRYSNTPEVRTVGEGRDRTENQQHGIHFRGKNVEAKKM